MNCKIANYSVSHRYGDTRYKVHTGLGQLWNPLMLNGVAPIGFASIEK